MAKTAKSVKRKRAPKQLALTPLKQVEQELRASVRRERNIGKLQGQLRRALAANRQRLTAFAEFLEAEGFIEKAPAPAEPQLPL